MSSAVDDLINSAPIVVFSSPTCPYCAAAISALKTDGKEFTLVNATREQRSKLLSITNVSSVPSVWVKGKYVGGCNDGPESWMGIKKMIANGKLNELLQD